MSSRDEYSTTPFPKPIEIKLADVLFLAMRKNLILFKNLSKQHVHYSFFIYDSTIDCHETLEVDHKHVPLLKIEFDWQVLLHRVMQEVTVNWKSIFQIVKTSDPKWENLEVEFLPAQVLIELLSPMGKRVRLDVDKEFLSKLEQSLVHSTVRDLAKYGVIIGLGSGYFVLSNGTDCILFDIDRLSEIIEDSFELSIRKIHLKHYNLRLTLWYVKIQLLKLTHSTIKRALCYQRKQASSNSSKEYLKRVNT